MALNVLHVPYSLDTGLGWHPEPQTRHANPENTPHRSASPPLPPPQLGMEGGEREGGWREGSREGGGEVGGRERGRD